ncbi:MAG: hypothetical protein WBO09_18135 [Methylocystis silviterrae]
MALEVFAESSGAKAARRLQGVFETHCDVKPVEDESRFWHHLPL